MGSSFLRKLTLIKQTGYGTYTSDLNSASVGVIPTGFKGDYHDMSEFQDPGESEYNGMLVPIGRPIQIGDMAEVPFDGDLTFENFEYLLNCGWQAQLTGSGGAAPYSRGYSIPAAGAINTPVITTIFAGDNSVNSGIGYAISDCLLTNFDISAARGGYTTASGTFSGHTLRTSTGTGIITSSRLAGTSIPAWMWQLSIGDTAGTRTTLAHTLIDWSMKVDNKYHHKGFQDGALIPTAYGQGRPDITLDLTFEQNANALTELVKFQTKTQRSIQLIARNDVSGNKQITLSLTGFYTAFDKPGDSDGNTTLKASFKCKYSITDNSYWTAITNSSTVTLFV